MIAVIEESSITSASAANVAASSLAAHFLKQSLCRRLGRRKPGGIMALPILLKTSRRPITVTMKTRGVLLDETLEDVIYANVRTATGRFGNLIHSVFVWIEDTNGPRDGSGIRCRIVATLARGGRLSASAEASNEYAAVAECASRARTLLDRLVKRRRRTRRPPRALRHQHI